jgi:hypothetical protein
MFTLSSRKIHPAKISLAYQDQPCEEDLHEDQDFVGFAHMPAAGRMRQRGAKR